MATAVSLDSLITGQSELYHKLNRGPSPQWYEPIMIQHRWSCFDVMRIVLNVSEIYSCNLISSYYKMCGKELVDNGCSLAVQDPVGIFSEFLIVR